jgi:PAS domain S-box-containing protein
MCTAALGVALAPYHQESPPGQQLPVEVSAALRSLPHSEEQLSRLAENMPFGLFVEVEERFHYLNPSCLALFGAREASELAGRCVIERAHPDDRESLLARIRGLHERIPSVSSGEERFFRLDGSLLFVDVFATSLTVNGRPGAFVLLRDTTEQKRQEMARAAAERALQDSRRLLECTVDLAQVVNWKFDPARDVFILDDRFYEVHGTDAASEGGYEIPASDFVLRFVHPYDVGIVSQALASSQIASAEQVSSVRHRIIRRNGTVSQFLSRYRLHSDLARGTILYGTSRDMTGLAQAEDRLFTMQAELKATVENVAAGVARVLPDQRFGQVNRAFCDFLGYSEKELVGRKLEAFIAPDAEGRDWGQVQRRLLSGESGVETADLCFLREDGSRSWGHITAQAVRDVSGQPLCLIETVEKVAGHRMAARAGA